MKIDKCENGIAKNDPKGLARQLREIWQPQVQNRPARLPKLGSRQVLRLGALLTKLIRYFAPNCFLSSVDGAANDSSTFMVERMLEALLVRDNA